MLEPHGGTVENTRIPTAGLGLPLAFSASLAAPEEVTRVAAPDLPPALPFIRETKVWGGQLAGLRGKGNREIWSKCPSKDIISAS